MESFFPSSRRAFSLVEALLVVAIVGIVAAIAVPGFSGLHRGTRAAKLTTDLKTINAAIDFYEANGGSLEGITDPQAILDKLKTVRESKDAEMFVGFTGSVVDQRLTAVMMGAGEADSDAPRAVWNAAENQFDIGQSGAGVKEFVLDAQLLSQDFGEESRADSPLNYNDDKGWIWRYEDRAPPPPAGPTEVAVSDPGSDPLPPAATLARLQAPVFNPSGGVSPFSDFPKPVTLLNPNDPSTWIEVSIDGGPFQEYTAAIQVSPGTVVRAFATGDPALWIPSPLITQTYQSTPPQILEPPVIQLSDPAFSTSTTAITVTLNNPNPPGSSELYYALKTPGDAYPPESSWTLYSGPLSVTDSSYPNGFHIKTYARSIDTDQWKDSEFAEAKTQATFFGIPLMDEVLFVVDASGSMDTDFGGMTRFQAVIQELISAIDSLGPDKSFNVAMFDGGVHWTDGSWSLLEGTAENSHNMIATLQTIEGGSGTNYEAGLSLPMMYNPKPVQVIFLSDGRPNSSYDYSQELNTLVGNGIRVDTVGIDLDSGALANLEEISNATGGTVVDVKAP